MLIPNSDSKVIQKPVPEPLPTSAAKKTGKLKQFLHLLFEAIAGGHGYNTHERYEKITDKLRTNRYRDLLERNHDVESLKKSIALRLDLNGAQYDSKVLARSFDYIAKFYSDKDGAPRLRKDGLSPRASHPLSVALGAAMLGCDFETVLTALFHDIYEDAIKPWGGGIVRAEHQIRQIAGEKIWNNVTVLSHNEEKESHEEYLRRVYNSRHVGVMVVKALDMLENLKTLYFEPKKDPLSIAAYENLAANTIEKALNHLGIWKKLNREFFELMHSFVDDHSHIIEKMRLKLSDRCSALNQQIIDMNTRLGSLDKVHSEAIERLKREISEKMAEYSDTASEAKRLRYAHLAIGKLKIKSLGQENLEMDGFAIVTSRGEADLHLFRSLPDSASPVLTLFRPETLQPSNYLEIEFPSFSGTNASYLLKRLNKHFPEMDFQPSISILPPLLRCTAIFRARMPEPEQYRGFLEEFRKLATEIRTYYKATSSFFNEHAQ
ncbi:HD domain-containing protein [Candidatus Parvarchaeota archaeon]|nr:HD domain-containing protein [Candidatus Parvarchaeota archaeon]